MSLPLTRALALLPLIAIAACDRSEPESEPPAFQRVLPGTASDAMLQTDTMRVPAPFAEPLPTGAPGEDGSNAVAPGKREPARRLSPDAAATGTPAVVATPTSEAAAPGEAAASPAAKAGPPSEPAPPP